MAGVHDWGGDLHNRRVDCCIFRLNFQGELIYKSVNSKDRRWCYVCGVHTDKRILVRECYCLWGWCAYYVIRMPYACVHPLWWLLWWYSVVCATMIVGLTACKIAGKNMSKAMGTASAWELNRVRWVYRTAGDRAGWQERIEIKTWEQWVCRWYHSTRWDSTCNILTSVMQDQFIN